MPSYTEGLPNALLEAMSSGNVCIAPRHIYKGYLKDKENVIMCSLDPKDIADKILILVNNPKLRKKIEKNARKFVEDNLKLEDMGKLYRDILLD